VANFLSGKTDQSACANREKDLMNQCKKNLHADMLEVGPGAQSWLAVDLTDPDSIRECVAGLERELSSHFVGPLTGSTLSQERTKLRMEAAARWRHLILAYLYAGDVEAAASIAKTLLSYHEDLQSAPLEAAPFNLEHITEGARQEADGRMFWLTRNRFFGSYLAFTDPRRL
jgi:hypothetical protein